MRPHTLFLIAALCVVVAGSAFAADDGNAKWRLSQATIDYPNTTYDVIPTTSGAGNVKGVQCKSDTNLTLTAGGYRRTVSFRTLFSAQVPRPFPAPG